MNADRRITYKDLFDEAKAESCNPGSRFGAKARGGAETVNATAKAGIAFVTVHAVIGAGRVAGFAQGFWRGVASRPNA